MCIATNAKDSIEIIFWLLTLVLGFFTVVAAFITAFEAIKQSRVNRRKRYQEFLWRKNALVREMIEKLFSDEFSKAALRMIDFNNTDIPTRAGKVVNVTRIDIDRSLEAGNGPFLNNQLEIRECFDSMLETFVLWEHYIQIELISFHDVKPPLEYYCMKMVADERLIGYMGNFGFGHAIKFIKRFEVH